MTPVPPKPTALIVDDDLGLMFCLVELFAKTGWNIVPALNCRQAVALAVMWDSHIDLIVVNPALNGIEDMVQTLSRVHLQMARTSQRVIMCANWDHQAVVET